MVGPQGQRPTRSGQATSRLPKKPPTKKTHSPQLPQRRKGSHIAGSGLRQRFQDDNLAAGSSRCRHINKECFDEDPREGDGGAPQASGTGPGKRSKTVTRAGTLWWRPAGKGKSRENHL